MLAHTHLIICGFVGAAAIIFLYELFKQKNYKQIFISFTILLIFFILLALQIFPALENCVFISKESLTINSLISEILSDPILMFPSMTG